MRSRIEWRKWTPDCFSLLALFSCVLLALHTLTAAGFLYIYVCPHTLHRPIFCDTFLNNVIDLAQGLIERQLRALYDSIVNNVPQLVIICREVSQTVHRQDELENDITQNLLDTRQLWRRSWHLTKNPKTVMVKTSSTLASVKACLTLYDHGNQRDSY